MSNNELFREETKNEELYKQRLTNNKSAPPTEGLLSSLSSSKDDNVFFSQPISQLTLLKSPVKTSQNEQKPANLSSVYASALTQKKKPVNPVVSYALKKHKRKSSPVTSRHGTPGQRRRGGKNYAKEDNSFDIRHLLPDLSSDSEHCSSSEEQNGNNSKPNSRRNSTGSSKFSETRVDDKQSKEEIREKKDEPEQEIKQQSQSIIAHLKKEQPVAPNEETKKVSFSLNAAMINRGKSTEPPTAQNNQVDTNLLNSKLSTQIRNYKRSTSSPSLLRKFVGSKHKNETYDYDDSKYLPTTGKGTVYPNKSALVDSNKIKESYSANYVSTNSPVPVQNAAPEQSNLPKQQFIPNARLKKKQTSLTTRFTYDPNATPYNFHNQQMQHQDLRNAQYQSHSTYQPNAGNQQQQSSLHYNVDPLQDYVEPQYRQTNTYQIPRRNSTQYYYQRPNEIAYSGPIVMRSQSSDIISHDSQYYTQQQQQQQQQQQLMDNFQKRGNRYHPLVSPRHLNQYHRLSDTSPRTTNVIGATNRLRRRKQICRYFIQGHCARGASCNYLHVVQSNMHRNIPNQPPLHLSSNMPNQIGLPPKRNKSPRPKPVIKRPTSTTTIEEVIGGVFSLCKDQQGCRFLQKKIEEQPEVAVEIIFKEIYQYFAELMVDPFGNYLCQKLLENCNDEQRLTIIKVVCPKLVMIAQNMHGTRAVQKLIELLSTPAQIRYIAEALRSSVVELIQDLNGNHVIQRCLNRLTSEQNQFIYDSVTARCVDVATHRHGCCVLQRCIDHASESQKEQLIQEVISNSLSLVQDPYGNYVTQYVLELTTGDTRDALIAQLDDNIVRLSTQKFSSNVVEKCLQLASTKQKAKIIQELIDYDALGELLQDPYANYVIQTALGVAVSSQYKALVEKIKPFLPALRHTPHGRRILKQVQRYK